MSTLKLKVPRIDADTAELKSALQEYREIFYLMQRRLKVAEDQLSQARVSRDSWKSKYAALTAPKCDKPDMRTGLEDSRETE